MSKWKEAFRRGGNSASQEVTKLREQLAATQAEVEALRKDAERYRWILHQAVVTDFIFKFLKSRERHISNAIDAAMKGEK